jgi:hypothetical protein
MLLTGFSRLCFKASSDGDIYSFEPLPFHEWKGREDRLTHFSATETEVLYYMKRPLAYITAAWSGDHDNDTKQAARYCRAAYEAGFSPVCPLLYLPLIIDDAIPEEHKSGIDIGRDLLRRSHVLVVCGSDIDEDVKNDIAIAGRLNITATTLDGIMTVKTQGRAKADA